MLRHGRLKHKANLRKPIPPRVEQTSNETINSTDDPPAMDEVVPVPNNPTSMDFDSCFSALDPSLCALWTLNDCSSANFPFLEALPAITIPNVHQILLENPFRDVLMKAVQTMARPPKIPSSSSLYRYVSLFIEKYLPHNPFLHSSVKPESENPLLLIAMASIGALYAVERKTALMLHTVSKNIEENLRSVLGCEDYPVWAVQAFYLNTVQYLLSGLNLDLCRLERLPKGCSICYQSYAYLVNGARNQ